MQSKFGTKNKTKKTTNHLRDIIVSFSRGYDNQGKGQKDFIRFDLTLECYYVSERIRISILNGNTLHKNFTISILTEIKYRKLVVPRLNAVFTSISLPHTQLRRNLISGAYHVVLLWVFFARIVGKILTQTLITVGGFTFN